MGVGLWLPACLIRKFPLIPRSPPFTASPASTVDPREWAHPPPPFPAKGLEPQGVELGAGLGG